MGSTIDGSGNTVVPSVPVIPVSSQPASILRGQTSNTMCGGFSSSALGSPHTYPSNETDQRNLALAGVAAVFNSSTVGWATNLWCQDSLGAWSLVTHTASQVLQVTSDFDNFRVSQSTALAKSLTSLTLA
jgi:hypothetical protein